MDNQMTMQAGETADHSASCCSTAEQEACCAPAEKAACCGTALVAGGECGCQ